jgi:enoyl-CoA hydratase/carnithine racemase
VQGICFPLGIELMLAADIVIAASDCRFAQLEVKRGIMPAGGATLRMVERAGWGNAQRYLLTGEEFGAAAALRLGLVQEVVAPGEQKKRALALAAASPSKRRSRSEPRSLHRGWRSRRAPRRRSRRSMRNKLR